MKRSLSLIFSVCLGTGIVATAAQARTEIQNKGSDTLVNVAQAWAEAYQQVDPEVAVAVSGGGSGTGIAALLNGTVDIANASRQIKTTEVEMAEQHGIHPLEHIVGYDALAVFLHADNPVNTLTVAQLREIFIRGGKATKWTDIGVEVPGCKNQQIVVVSRQNNSGTYAYFKEAVLEDGKYRQGTLDMHGSKDVVDLVEKTPCAIGYSGLAYATDHVKMVCVAGGSDPADCVSPSPASASDGSYPIARPLFMYTDGEPQGKIKEYLDWVKSDAGQCIIRNKGYAPLRDVSCQ